SVVPTVTSGRISLLRIGSQWRPDERGGVVDLRKVRKRVSVRPPSDSRGSCTVSNQLRRRTSRARLKPSVRPFLALTLLISLFGSSIAVRPALASSAPGVPTNVAVTASNGAALVSWAKPSDNGAAITSYSVTVETTTGSVAQVAQVSCSTGPVAQALITGLSDGTAYQFDVLAS